MPLFPTHIERVLLPSISSVFKELIVNLKAKCHGNYLGIGVNLNHPLTLYSCGNLWSSPPRVASLLFVGSVISFTFNSLFHSSAGYLWSINSAKSLKEST